jgi:hypothetical protein
MSFSLLVALNLAAGAQFCYWTLDVHAMSLEYRFQGLSPILGRRRNQCLFLDSNPGMETLWSAKKMLGGKRAKQHIFG